MQDHRYPKYIALLLLLSSLAAAPASDAIKIDKHPATFETKLLDPAHPPPDMAKLAAGEKAFTWCAFHTNWKFQYRATDTARGAVDVEITGMQITLDLAITLYAPKDVPFLLKAHEQGHRTIGEWFYKDADSKASAIASNQLIGKHIHGEGRDHPSAVEAALAAAGKTFLDAYVEQTSTAAQTVHDTYDQLTNHGRNLVPPPTEAVKQAIEKYQKSH